MNGTTLHGNLTGAPILDQSSSAAFVFAVLVYGANSHYLYKKGIGFHPLRYQSLNEGLGMAVAVIPAGVTIALVVSMIGQFWYTWLQGGRILGFDQEGQEDGS
ncbi:uncharacterized protein EAF01_005817 [Botrytis porri]|uniref:Uncharacterized protein n=1 Tax=Botrytis porri TaxID=87229 RepID=A0A4Z1L5Z7_9HELO|nr:uncharacterized protein EAF01_005817 [Botrytis porri]KAF7905296.1 hypothetical protein EAF01_005817 [Botrytis porri]TGO92195.1 hypothetical protein BPOR_0008g00350 [Botrytis porri]